MRLVNRARRPLNYALAGIVVAGISTAIVTRRFTNTAGVTSFAFASPISRAQVSDWIVASANASEVLSTQTAPNGAAVIEFTMTANGTFTAQDSLVTALDLRPYDSFYFWAKVNPVRTSDFVYLQDSNGNKRWFSLLFHGTVWHQQEYFINKYVSQDASFDLTHVVKVRFGQVGEVTTDKLYVSAVSFEVDAVNHADAPSAWQVDVGTGTLTTTTSPISGTAILAPLTASTSNPSQADIATGKVLTGISWDFSKKRYFNFYFKDNDAATHAISHYFLVYSTVIVGTQQQHCYREWLFDAQAVGTWTKVMIDVTGTAYVDSCTLGPFDLTNVDYIETGVYAGAPSAAYSFSVDEFAIH